MSNDKPILTFKYGYDERSAFETPMKGWRGDGIVELPNGDKYSVFFYDPVRLAQDFETEKVIAEPGLIVIEEVNMENMVAAVEKLWKIGYFKSLVPIKKTDS